MGLMQCPDCGKEISDSAEVCIGCGRPMREPREKIMAELQIALSDLKCAEDFYQEESDYWAEHPSIDGTSGDWTRLQASIDSCRQKVNELRSKL